jgi:multiple sugar transport system substrate-binding protein
MNRHLHLVSWVAALLLLTSLLLPLLAGCGQSTPKPVSFMIFGDPVEVAAYQKLVAAFQARYPDIPVELRPVADEDSYMQQLVTTFSAGAPPDVILLNYRRIVQFASQGGLEAVGPYLAASKVVQEGDFYPTAMSAFRWDGKLWCIPQNASSLVVYYNRDLFTAAGLPLPANDWTRDDFLAAARALTKDLNGDGQVDQYGVGVQASLMRLAPFIWQDGGELLDNPTQPTRLTLDSPATLVAFRWFVDLQVVEHVTPDRVAETAESSESRFLNGRLGMYLNSRRAVPTLRTITGFTWDVAPLPRGAQTVSILHGDGFCMAAASKNKDAAWTFIEFSNSAAGQEILAGTGRTVPSLRAVAESPAFLDPAQAPANSRVFLDVIPTLRQLPLLAQWPAIESAVNKEIDRAFYGDTTVEGAAAAAGSATAPYFQAGP